jgi:hypothetical protein
VRAGKRRCQWWPAAVDDGIKAVRAIYSQRREREDEHVGEKLSFAKIWASS